MSALVGISGLFLCVSGCVASPAGQALARELFVNTAASAAAAGASQAVQNEVNSSMTYHATCPNCQQVNNWQGRVTTVKCYNCANQFNVSYGQ
ncbi:MAG: hypothetical protein NTW87_24190 [Planctomycetota bacterium]|nr:hypothetical protein [Planctomycetota bacterium]